MTDKVSNAYFVGYCSGLDVLPDQMYIYQERAAFALGRYHRLILKGPILLYDTLKGLLEKGITE